jgi:diacylglycerol kinase family enzyme
VRLALIANPRSGTAPGPQCLEKLLGREGAEVHTTAIQELSGEGDGGLDDADVATVVSRLSAHGRPDRVVVAGGDGSIGLTARLAGAIGVPLAVVPTGTANDFARAYDLPLDLDEACALARSPRARARHADLARIGRRTFVNAASAGLSVIAARAARPHKHRLGALAYAVGALKAGLSASPLRGRVLCDGELCYASAAWQIVVAVTGAFGGGSEIGGADPADGLLDVAVVPAGSRASLVRRAYGMRTGRLTQQAPVVHRRGAVIELQLDGRPAFNVDGELCDHDCGRFTVVPGGFEVVVP